MTLLANCDWSYLMKHSIDQEAQVFLCVHVCVHEDVIAVISSHLHLLDPAYLHSKHCDSTRLYIMAALRVHTLKVRRGNSSCKAHCCLPVQRCASITCCGICVVNVACLAPPTACCCSRRFGLQFTCVFAACSITRVVLVV